MEKGEWSNSIIPNSATVFSAFSGKSYIFVLGLQTSLPSFLEQS